MHCDSYSVTVTVSLFAGLTAEKKGEPEVSFVFAVKVNMQESEKYNGSH